MFVYRSSVLSHHKATLRAIWSRVSEVCVFVSIAATLAACQANRIAHNPLPEKLVGDATVLSLDSARTWADSFSSRYYEALEQRERQVLKSGLYRQDVTVLVLSGGGQNGAFGAGYLNGWTDRGNRPEFEIVTGVSTGALIAPLAFLGPKYDADLRRFYTTVSTKDILKRNFIGGILGGSALTNSEPLAELIAEYVTPDFLNKVAREHQSGRRLALITTNIEAQRPVIWDMGQIAEVGTPQALHLFRSIMLASASIPGAFPPVRIDVSANGKSYSELHVDGATTTNIFLAPFDLTVSDISPKRKARFYILTNGKYLPEYKPIKVKTLSIASRAISTMVKYITKADVQRLRLLASRTGSELRFISIPNDFAFESSETFDESYMNALFDFGYAAGLSGELETTDPKVF